MNSFGEWLKNERISKNIYQETLAQKAGIKAATVSRVENGMGDVLVDTAYRICQALEVQLPELLSALDYPHQLNKEGKTKDISLTITASMDLSAHNDFFSISPDVVVTFEDLTSFQNKLISNWEDTRFFLARWMQETSEKVSQRFQSGASFIFFPEQVDNLLNHSPFVTFKINYPQLPGEILLQNYHLGGVLLPIDVGEFIRWNREHRKVTLDQFTGEDRPSKSALSRLESGSLERVRLQDIFALDRELNQKGDLIGMYWNVAQYSTNHEQILDKLTEVEEDRIKKLSPIFIIGCRWWQLLSPIDEGWLQKVREGLEI